AAHGGRHRSRLRFPDAHRPSVQYTGDGARRLPVRRLLAPRSPVVIHRAADRRAAHPAVLAAIGMGIAAATLDFLMRPVWQPSLRECRDAEPRRFRRYRRRRSQAASPLSGLAVSAIEGGGAW